MIPLLRLVAAAGLVAAALATASTSAQARTPFTTIGGTWAGSGSARLSSGETERLRCRAYYNPKSGGSRMGLAIRCASAGNKIELRSQLNYANGLVSGNWTETNFNASGSLTGRARPGRISLTIRGGLTGSLTLSFGRGSQTVSLRTSTTSLRSVNISLSRR
ncbi:MAG: hypothetical protein AAFQ45_02750 [Pseudomonadota bacterium]